MRELRPLHVLVGRARHAACLCAAAAMVAGCGEARVVVVVVEGEALPPVERLDVRLSIRGEPRDASYGPPGNETAIALATSLGVAVTGVAGEGTVCVGAIAGGAMVAGGCADVAVARGRTREVTVVLAGCTAAGDACCRVPAAPDGVACDDGAFCTSPDYCTAGVCSGDPNPCGGTGCEVGCDETADTCSGPPPPDGAPCNDGAFCTTGEACAGGTCAGGLPRDCASATDPCNDGVCEEGLDRCAGAPRADGTPCDDATFCNGVEVCSAGACVAGAAPCAATASCELQICDEGTASCTPGGTAPDGTACDDGLVGTTGETCLAGVCGCTVDEDGDGYRSLGCGGYDCDDTIAEVNPSAWEALSFPGRCMDGVSNDCDPAFDPEEEGCGGMGTGNPSVCDPMCGSGSAMNCCQEDCDTAPCICSGLPGTCVFDCSDTSCAVGCANDTEWGRCFVNCRNAASCEVTCGANTTACYVDCTGATSCHVWCGGAGDPTQCYLDCTDSTDCFFTSCGDGTFPPTTCEGDVEACDATCPEFL